LRSTPPSKEHTDRRYAYFFSIRVVDVWNSLPASMLQFCTTKTFKRHLDSHLKERGCVRLISYRPKFLSLMPATHARETCTRNWYQNLAPETCTKNLSQIYRSFFLQNNRPANHVERFVSRAGQFLCRNAAVCYCVQETCTRKKTCDPNTCASFSHKTTCDYQFLVQVS